MTTALLWLFVVVLCAVIVSTDRAWQDPPPTITRGPYGIEGPWRHP